jgi:hypothetical protein
MCSELPKEQWLLVAIMTVRIVAEVHLLDSNSSNRRESFDMVSNVLPKT